MENKNTPSEVETVLDGGGGDLTNHYSVLARKVVEKYGPDSVEAVVAQLYRDDMHGYVPDDEAYTTWLEMRRCDLQDLKDVIRRSEKLLMLRKDLTWCNYVYRASGDVFARRVLTEDILLRLYNAKKYNKFDAVYASTLRQLRCKMNWLSAHAERTPIDQ